VSRRLLLLLALGACTQKPIGDPAGSNNFDDPFDPGQNGINSGTPDASGDAYGRFCVAPRDCPAAFLCAYPVADLCGATGRCLPYTQPDVCDAAVACGCDNAPVPMCAPQGYTPHPVRSLGSCDGGVVVEAGPDASDAGDQ
jgi:hypothetical protein